MFQVDTARPPLAHSVVRLKMSVPFPLRGGRRHFFERRSLSATLSSIVSVVIVDQTR